MVTGTAVPLDRSDIDTDQIIPSDWLKRVERTGFEKGLFSEWRDSRDFVLNDERYAGARILVAGPNFGEQRQIAGRGDAAAVKFIERRAILAPQRRQVLAHAR